MLVLSRKKQEAVLVGGVNGVKRLVKVTVLDINGRNVRLGFEADADIPIMRCEVCDRILAAELNGAPKPIAALAR